MGVACLDAPVFKAVLSCSCFALNNLCTDIERNNSGTIYTCELFSFCSGGQFKATELWNAVVTYVRENVEVGRRRAIIKQHDHCFTGAEAVDVALQWLNLQKGNFTRDVTREKAVKVCSSSCFFQKPCS